MQKLIVPAALLVLLFSCKKDFQPQPTQLLSLLPAAPPPIADTIILQPIDSVRYWQLYDSLQVIFNAAFPDDAPEQIAGTEHGFYPGDPGDNPPAPPTTPGTPIASSSVIPPYITNYPELPYGGCGGDGAYHASGISGGSFFGATMTATFFIQQGQITNFNLGSDGLRFDWSYEQTSSYAAPGATTGVVYGHATQSFNELFGASISFQIAMTWSLDAVHCRMYYHWKKI